MKEKLEGVREKWDRYKYALMVALVGIGLLIWPTGQNLPEEEEQPPAAILQKEMERVLSKIAGVGQVQVLLTLETDGERILAQDTRLSYSGNALEPEEYEKTSEIILKDGASGDEALITRRAYPAYRGALIVCQGGNQAAVRLAVTEAVSVLTGLPSDRISVAKWQ